MAKPVVVSHLRKLMRGDPATGGNSISRVGRIVRLLRPGIALEGNALPVQPPPTLPSELRPFAPKLADIAATHATAIGRIDVRCDDCDEGWLRIGTGWVVSPGGGGTSARILTAGHVLAFMLRDRSVTRQLRRVPVGTAEPRALRQTRVTFADRPDPGTQGIEITSVIWPHALWDVMICELAIPLPVVPPPLEFDPAWFQDPQEPMAVLGYPVEQGFIPPNFAANDSFANVFEGPLGTRRISPGFCLNVATPPSLPDNHEQAEDVLLRHDASTLGGNSGSPVFSLRTGSVVGVHTSGGQFHVGGIPDPDKVNRGVPMPLLLGEARMREELENTVALANRTAPVNRPRPQWIPAQVDPADESVSPYIGAGPADIPASLVAAAIPDRPDTRDWFYTPPMCAPKNAVPPVRGDARVVRNQRSEPACVGFALAAMIDIQRRKTDAKAPPISARMLYEMALTQDEWIDDRIGGSSLRAGIKGFFLSGVCKEAVAPWIPGQRSWAMTRRAARDARNVTPGAYFRLRHRLADFQSAIQEMGAIVVSAHIHAGWIRSDGKRIHSIRYSQNRIGAHAFAVVGYDAKGFFVQNSWGSHWGGWNGIDGVAHWSYADWAENLIDAWVIRLAPQAPSGFGLIPPASGGTDNSLPFAIRNLPRATRHALLGHVIHAERDGIVEIGRLGLGLGALREAVSELCNPKQRPDCPHLLILNHDPFLGAEAISRVAGHLTPTLLKNGIFPLHIAYGVDELDTVTARMKQEAAVVADRFGHASQEANEYLERRASRLCGRLLSDFVVGAQTAAQPGGSLWQPGAALCIEAAKGRTLTILSFGTGAVAASAQINEAARIGEPTVTRLIQISPTTIPDEKGKYDHDIMPLDPARSSDDLPPYLGDWADIVHKTFGAVRCSPRGDRSIATPGNLSACYTNKELLNALIAKIKGRAPSPTMRFR